MLDSFPIGRFFSIPVRVHWTLVLILIWRLHSAISAGTGVGEALLFNVVLWVSILLHEFGHIGASRMMGNTGPHEVLLWPLGGLAMSHRQDEGAAQTFVTVLCGPLVSALLWGGATLLSMAVLPFLDHLPTGVADLLWDILSTAVWINMSLLLFNIIPAFPMDGGQILHSLIWMRFGRRTAAKVCAPIAGICALGFGVVALTTSLILFLIAIFVGRSAYELWRTADSEPTYAHHRRQLDFRRAARQRQLEPLHRCSVCGRTERDDRTLDFRVDDDGREYCMEHLGTDGDKR